MKVYDFVIIGGGLTGLSAAYYLSKANKKVLILEKNPEVGGLLSSWSIGNHYLEKYYHHVSLSDKFFVGMLNDLGMDKKLLWKKASIGYYYDGKIFPMNTPLDMLRFKGFNFTDLIRLVSVILKVKLKDDYSDLDRIPAKEWILENAGDGVYRNFFEPLLKSKFGSDMDKISAAWLFGRIKFRSNRSLEGETLGYMRNGFHKFTEKLADLIRGKGGDIMTNSEVVGIEQTRVKTRDDVFSAKSVISTIPPKNLSQIAEFGQGLHEKLERISHQDIICVTMCLKSKLLDNIYWLNIKSDDIPFGAIIEHTNFHNIPQYDGEKILYLAHYSNHETDPLWVKSDEEIAEMFMDFIGREFPSFNKESVIRYKIARDLNSGPLYEVGYLENINSIPLKSDNIYITGMFRSYPERSMNESLKLGYDVAKRCLNESG